MEAKADEIFVQMNSDYMRVLGVVTADQPIRVQSREEAEMKTEIRNVLKTVNAQFESIANGDIESQEKDAGMEDGEPINVEKEDESVAFDSAQEFADHDADDAPAEQTSEHDEQDALNNGANGPST
jgi:hypothetical protein